MKKYLGIITLFTILFSGCSVKQSQIITMEEAKNIVENATNVPRDEAVYVKMKLDQGQGEPYYHLEFYTDRSEYDYEVNAITGEIINYDHNISDIILPDNVIMVDEAKDIAFSDVEVAEGDITTLEISVDFVKGIMVYDLSFVANGKQYQVLVDATTKQVLQVQTK